MLFELPTKLNIGGTDYAIRSDYRAVLEICTALSDRELSDEERILVAMEVFYPDLDNMSPSVYKEALENALNRKVDKVYIYSISLGKEIQILQQEM